MSVNHSTKRPDCCTAENRQQELSADSPEPIETGPDWSLLCGDCCEVFPQLPECPQLIFADPPFNIGHRYDGYRDSLSQAEYEEFTERWMRASWDRLSPDGLLTINVPDAVMPVVLRIADHCGMHRIEWIIWHFRFGQCTRSGWITSKVHCPVFARDRSNYTWNPDAVLVPSDRASRYSDRRTQMSATPGRRVPYDVWGVPSDGDYWGRVQGNNRERSPGHPNQLPEVYLERIIRAYSNPGDLVCDPFTGSGTTPTVAVALGRRFVGVEISDASCRSAAERIRRGPVRVRPELSGEQTSDRPVE